MSKQKPSLPPEIAEAAADVEQYEDRRAIPGVGRDYYVENDPILAEGDPMARLEDAGSAFIPEDGPSEPITVQEAVIDNPLVELAADADPLTRLAAAIEKLANRERAASPIEGQLLAKLAQVIDKLSSGQIQSTEAILKGKDPSNFFSTEISAFNPRGDREYPRPMLKCKMHLPWEAERECLTREEIELLNLLEPGDFLVKRNDDSMIKVTVRARSNANTHKPEVLLMNSETGFNNDYAWLMPPLRVMLRQMLKQRADTRDAAQSIMTMEEELELIEKHGIHFSKVLAVT